MNIRVAPVALLAVFLLGAGEGEKKGPPYADGPKTAKKQKPKPETRAWTVKKDGFSFSFTFIPGIPNPGEVTEILIKAEAIPKTPHPKYGSRIPLNARIVLEVSNPAGEIIGRYLAHPIPRSRGKYGLHVTPSQDGIFDIALVGKTAQDKPLNARVKLPVNVWPLPPELEGSGDDGGKRSTVRRQVIRRPFKKQ